MSLLRIVLIGGVVAGGAWALSRIWATYQGLPKPSPSSNPSNKSPASPPPDKSAMPAPAPRDKLGGTPDAATATAPLSTIASATAPSAPPAVAPPARPFFMPFFPAPAVPITPPLTPTDAAAPSMTAYPASIAALPEPTRTDAIKRLADLPHNIAGWTGGGATLYNELKAAGFTAAAADVIAMFLPEAPSIATPSIWASGGGG